MFFTHDVSKLCVKNMMYIYVKVTTSVPPPPPPPPPPLHRKKPSPNTLGCLY